MIKLIGCIIIFVSGILIYYELKKLYRLFKKNDNRTIQTK
jgi:hypothetical protein